MVNLKKSYYFGYGGGGHFLRSSINGSTLDPQNDIPGFPWDITALDTGLLKNRKVPDIYTGEVHWVYGGRPSPWFAFVWWDRSGDKRPASNSGFYVSGFNLTNYSAKNVFDFGCQEWPEVVSRQQYPLILQDLP